MKKYTFTFLLLALMALKVSALTSYLHQQDCEHDDCEVCELAIYHQHVVFSAPDPLPSLEVPAIAHGVCWHNHYKSIRLSTPLHTFLFGRPPPIVT